MKSTPTKADRVIRCAVYTRKSSEEGLEKEFNSLDAQRESAEAFIASQRGEGWHCLPDKYDDGGYTGGNTERPALRRLLADIEAGKVDAVVVYKVDRLSRSLMDFAKMMEVFERHKVSFVSVTQQFNTTHSMGRLTLNILLSFAQFEREIISERTRDKIAAARRKGKWAGGRPVLGYDVVNMKLIVNPAEAAQVRDLFETYLRTESISRTAAHATAMGTKTKEWSTKEGRRMGGLVLRKSLVHRILTNSVYIGKVESNGQLYQGEQEAILDQHLWDRAQAMLTQNSVAGGAEVRNKHGAILKGLLRCRVCDQPMVHNHTTTKNGRCHRYYICSSARTNGAAACPCGSLPATEVENLVVARIKAVGRDRALVAGILEQAQAQEQARVEDLEAQLRSLDRERKWVPDRDLSNPDAAARVLDIETRRSGVEDELRSLRRQLIRRDRAEAVGAAFDPLWGALSTRERAEVMRLIVRTVEYDGNAGEMTINFHPEHQHLGEGAA